LERAFSQVFIPDSYELINVYKLYDIDLSLELEADDKQMSLRTESEVQFANNLD